MDELELVVFDMAGTTVEDRGEVPAAFVAALAGQGIEVTSEQIKSVRGSSKRQALRQFIPAGPAQAQLADEAYAAFQAHLAHRYTTEGVRAIAGAPDVFRALRERGVRVALNTGFDREITELLLGALGWNNGLVDAVVCGDEVTQGRPAPYLIFRAMERTGASDVHKVAKWAIRRWTCWRAITRVWAGMLGFSPARTTGRCWKGCHTRICCLPWRS